MSISIDLNDKRLNFFKACFFDDQDVELDKLFISKFDGWLTREEYNVHIVNAELADIERINSTRLAFFKSFYDMSVIADFDKGQFVVPKTIEVFEELCREHLDDSEGFLIVDCVNWVAVNTSYDYTDVCYFTNVSKLEQIKTFADRQGLYTFK